MVWLEVLSLRLKVTSIEYSTFLLHFIISSSPYFLNDRLKYFFIHSDLGPFILFNTARPASLYKSTSLLLYFSLILFNIKMPTNSQTSASSYAPMVTSKMFPSLYIQGFSLLNKSDFLAWYIICMSSVLISVISFANGVRW